MYPANRRDACRGKVPRVAHAIRDTVTALANADPADQPEHYRPSLSRDAPAGGLYVSEGGHFNPK